MRLSQTTNSLRSSGAIGEQSEFKIVGNAKIFKMLSNMIYKDKVGSIVRELTCNATDSHIEAGRVLNEKHKPTTPVWIHLPNALEPWFSVRDEGVGMSDEVIKTLYSSYGESSKDQSNEVTGAFGLGSKTPFAYTDQFTVISTFNGVQNTYVAAMNNEELPVINLQDQRETNAHSGVEVMLAVQSKDFAQFEDAVKKQLMFLPVKPILLNNMKDIVIPDVFSVTNISYRSKTTVLFTSQYEEMLTSLWVVQGGVGYELDISLLDGVSSDIKDFARALDRQHGYMIFPIGTIGVTASREGISYDAQTIANIVTGMETLQKEMLIDLKKELYKAKTIWDRCAAFNKQMIINKMAIAKSVSLPTMFKGAYILDSTMPNNQRPPKAAIGFDNIKDRVVMHKLYRHKFYRNNSSGKGWRFRKNDFQSANVNSHYYGEYITPTDDLVVIVRDVAKKPVVRLTKYFDDNEMEAVVYVEGKAEQHGIVSYRKDFIAKQLCIDPSKIIMVSELPLPVLVPSVGGRAATNLEKATGFKYDRSLGHVTSRNWERINDLDVNNGVLVPMERHCFSPDVLDKVDRLASMRDVDPVLYNFELIAVNKRTVERIEAGKVGTMLVTLDAALKGQLAKLEKFIPTYRKYVRVSALLSKIEFNRMWKVLDSADAKSARILVKIETLKTIKKELHDKISTQEKILKIVVNTFDEQKKGHEKGDAMESRINARFPMLQFLPYYTNDDVVKVAIDYIKMVESAC